MGFDIGSAIGGIASAYASAKAADRATKRQIEWERERATHAHQWEVEDLKAAGLNPILSAGGSGAVTGGISAPVPDFSGLSTISSNSSAASQAKTAKKAQAAQQKMQEAQVKQADQNTKNLQIQNKILAAQAAEETSNSALKIKENKMQENYLKSKIGKGLHYFGKGINDVGAALVGGTILGGMGIVGKAMSAKKAVQAAKSAEFAKKLAISNAEKQTFATMNGFIDR